MNANSCSPKLRVAVIGLGRIGFDFHAPEIVKHPGFSLAGVFDPLPERRDEAAAKWSVPTFDSLESLLRETRPDVAVIASPTAFHAEQACAAYAHGAHVFCDKPVARSIVEFDAMLAAARRANRRFLAYQPHRLKPPARVLKKILASGLLGEVHLIKRACCSYHRRCDWQAFRANGGGMLNNYASHFIDELLWLLQPEIIRSVFCRTWTVATAGDAEDVVKIILTTDRNRLLDLDISQANALTGPAFQVFGATGAAVLEESGNAWRVKYFDPKEAPPLVAQTGLAATNRRYDNETLPWREKVFPCCAADELDYYDAAWRHFALGEPPPVAPEETRLLLQIIERCRESDATGAVT